MIGSVLLGGGMFLAGCSGASSSSASSSGAADRAAAPVPAGVPAAASAAAQGDPRTQGGTTTARLAPASSIIYTAQLTVRAGNVTAAVAQATQIAQDAGGYVPSETASVNPDHPSEATASVQLKIPVAAYPATLGQLAGRLGTQLSRQQQAQDVTQQVADVNSQVTSDEAAIAQLRALLSHAGSVGDLLSVQNQINQRGNEPGIHAGPAARPQPRDQLRDGDAHPARPEGHAAGCESPRPRWPAASAPAGTRCASPCPGRWPSSAR